MVDIRDLPFPIVVTEVHALGEFQLALTFKDGKQEIFDMKPYLGKGVFKDLENQGYFSLVTIENGTASWPNGADMAPERLYTDRIAAYLNGTKGNGRGFTRV